MRGRGLLHEELNGRSQHSGELVIGTARETIGHEVGLALDVLDVEVVVRQDILPSGLASRQLRLRLELRERFVIGHDRDGELGAHQVVAPRLERNDDGEQLLFVDGVAGFRIQHLLRQIRDRL